MKPISHKRESNEYTYMLIIVNFVRWINIAHARTWELLERQRDHHQNVFYPSMCTQSMKDFVSCEHQSMITLCTLNTHKTLETRISWKTLLRKHSQLKQQQKGFSCIIVVYYFHFILFHHQKSLLSWISRFTFCKGNFPDDIYSLSYVNQAWEAEDEIS